MQKGIIMIWCTNELPWKLTQQISLSLSAHISFSCLSYNQHYLAIVNGSRNLVLFCITHDVVIQISQQPCFTHTFVQNVTYCDISKNEQYVAVGFESGQIHVSLFYDQLICVMYSISLISFAFCFQIIDIQEPTEIYCQLLFHINPIIQLYWAPATINAPILLSLTSDELAWWNIDLTKNNMKNQKKMKRSRMGISHSTSTPSFNTNVFLNLQMSNSRSVDTGVSNLQDDEASSAAVINQINCISKYWKNKIGKDPEKPELLAVVESPPSRNGKVCSCSDFTKFVIVDMHGSINTFEPIDSLNQT